MLSGVVQHLPVVGRCTGGTSTCNCTCVVLSQYVGLFKPFVPGHVSVLSATAPNITRLDFFFLFCKNNRTGTFKRNSWETLICFFFAES